jgi:hypothetical protein
MLLSISAHRAFTIVTSRTTGEDDSPLGKSVMPVPLSADGFCLKIMHYDALWLMRNLKRTRTTVYLK